MRPKYLITAAALALSLAACGGGDDGADTTAAPTQAPGGEEGGGSAEAGLTIYDGTCTTCHGVGGVGVENLGKPLANSDFVSGMTDAELIEFIKVGRAPSDPENTSGVAMPPKGGNPALDDADLADVVAYLRTLN